MQCAVGTKRDSSICRVAVLADEARENRRRDEMGDACFKVNGRVSEKFMSS